jgi:hypothetical protein
LLFGFCGDFFFNDFDLGLEPGAKLGQIDHPTPVQTDHLAPVEIDHLKSVQTDHLKSVQIDHLIARL